MNDKSTKNNIALPEIVSRDKWLAKRKELLKKEKELTRLRDELSAERRKLPMVRIEKDYVFEGLNGVCSLADLFDGHSQLIVYHFMFAPDWEEGCKSYSFVADDFSGALRHLADYDTVFAAVSRAPIAKIKQYKVRMGWDFPWLSSFGTDFNYDFHVTLDENHMEYDYTPPSARPAHMQGEGEWPGLSVFVLKGGQLCHTYSTYARGLDALLTTYSYLDLTPLGR